MKIAIFFPNSAANTSGNRITAIRWAGLLKELGHDVSISTEYLDEAFDLVVRLHALKTSAIESKVRERHPNTKVIVTLTGTDIRGSSELKAQALDCLRTADSIICLNSNTLDELPTALRQRAIFIPQSAASATPPPRSEETHFDVLVAGHLREEKDPMRTALASRALPSDSRIRVRHFGRALEDKFVEQATEEMRRNDRYQWFGEIPHQRLLEEIAKADLVVQSSRVDEGPSVLAEAIEAQRPVLISRIPGLQGVLGEDYPGSFNVEDTNSLKELLLRAERDKKWRETLISHSHALRSGRSREAEITAWRNLLATLAAR